MLIVRLENSTPADNLDPVRRIISVRLVVQRTLAGQRQLQYVACTLLASALCRAVSRADNVQCFTYRDNIRTGLHSFRMVRSSYSP